MDPQDERELATPVICPNCGAPNASQDVRCNSCGAWLGGQGQVIDVTTGEPEPIEEREQYSGWQDRARTVTFDQGRVTVVRGGSRTCLMFTVLATLVGCCLCWVFWSGFGTLF